MGHLPGPAPDFTDFYQKPTIQRMLKELSDHEFEHFVKYVFEQAGYFVEDTAGQFGHGLDLFVPVKSAFYSYSTICAEPWGYCAELSICAKPHCYDHQEPRAQ